MLLDSLLTSVDVSQSATIFLTADWLNPNSEHQEGVLKPFPLCALMNIKVYSVNY